MKDVELAKRLYIKNAQKQAVVSWQEITDEYNEIKGTKLKPSAVRHYLDGVDKGQLRQFQISDEKAHHSERLIEIGTSERLSEDEVILRHGLDPKCWEVSTLGSTRSKIGTKADEGHFINTYQKALFKPREVKLSMDLINELLESITDRSPIIIETKVSKPHGMLLIPLKDMHFGHNSYNTYKPHQAEIYQLIKGQQWERIVFIIGSDLYHTNDSKGRTANDTQVDWNVRIEKRTEWAKQFYQPLLEIAQECGLIVEVIFEEGNHDKDQALMFVLALKWLYPNIKFIIEEKKIYKIIQYHGCCIGTHHGDKKSKPKDVAETFNNYFRKQFADAKYREVLIGHKHHLWSESHLDILIQGLSTASEATEYEYDHGWAESDKSFQVRIYKPTGLKGVIVIDGKE